MTHIWIFKGEGASPFPSGVFSEKEKADNWIKNNKLSGVLIEYPLDISLYEWAISSGLFTPKNELQETPKFIQNFTCASTNHFHYIDGVEE
ncbi:hypothetical protein [Bacteroides sp. 224]|uniref:DUF7710 domain-containing protein n=1 Tax=Bacteroides sp. 224 TaxID=2302936 RepID=UPI0013D779AA|nr:hypothetical protein [Bacteroides sp. 224]NDV66711.1 hypothetical protein [Bacteroides sp. 224]